MKPDRLILHKHQTAVGSVCRCGGVRWRERRGMDEKKEEERERVLEGPIYWAITAVRQPSDSQTITAHYLTDLPADSPTDTLCVCLCVHKGMR